MMIDRTRSLQVDRATGGGRSEDGLDDAQVVQGLVHGDVLAAHAENRVAEALVFEGEGLAPTWDGSGASTITLERLRWYPVPGDA